MKYKKILIAILAVVILSLIWFDGVRQNKREEAERVEQERLEFIEGKKFEEEEEKELEDSSNDTDITVDEEDKKQDLGREKKHELVWYVKGQNIYHTTYEKCDASSYKDVSTGEYTKEVLWDWEDETDKELCGFCHQVESNKSKPQWLKDPGF